MIKSMLDTDLYKFTMMQVVFEKYPNAMVRYDFKDRNGTLFNERTTEDGKLFNDIGVWIKELCNLKITKEEIDYLRSIRFFKPGFIEFLRTFQLNHDYIRYDTSNGFNIIVEGPWLATIAFEVPILAIVSELFHYHNGDGGINTYLTGKENFLQKLNYLDNHLHRDSDFRIVDLGTRRRFSYEWHKEILSLAKQRTNWITGTSNVHFAKEFGFTPVGTMAHEYICAHQQLGRVEDSQKAAFQTWADVYRGDLGIALSDTVGFNAFLRDFDLYFSKLFDGVRHDSGCPYHWCETLIKHYDHLGIDSNSKVAVFSDGLTFPIAVDLFKAFSSQIKTTFGIGTNFTNDLGAEAQQIVMKMTECNGRPVAKVSDSPGKEMCLEPKFEEYVKGIFDV